MAKVRRIIGTAKKKARNFEINDFFYVVEHKNEGLRNEKAPDASRTRGF
jgi:hypothetical protein